MFWELFYLILNHAGLCMSKMFNLQVMSDFLFDIQISHTFYGFIVQCDLIFISMCIQNHHLDHLTMKFSLIYQSKGYYKGETDLKRCT